jgi:outer membrane protein TolC
MFDRICVFVVAVLLIAWCADSFSSAAQNDGGDLKTKITELMTQRRDTLRERFTAVQARYNSGTMSVDAVITANDDLLDAELELASSKPERLELCKKRVENLRGLEKVLAQRHEQGSASIESKLLATAARLQAEIDCLREQSTAK